MIKKTPSIAILFFALVVMALTIVERDLIASTLVEYTGFVQIEKNIFVAPETKDSDNARLLSLIREAKSRVASIYPGLSFDPVIIAARDMDSLKLFSANEYGSTHFLPWGAYIVVGPKGFSIDIIAHELAHAGVYEKLGYWIRLTQVPIWFDEGVAMQVDFRGQYDSQAAERNSQFVTELKYGRQFFKGDSDELTGHYAAAKAEVKRWVRGAGPDSVQRLLKKLSVGEDFDDIYKTMMNTSPNASNSAGQYKG